MHRIVVVAMDGVVPFDLAVPSEAFLRVRLPDGRPGYRVRVCGTRKEVDAGVYGLRLAYGLGELARADTVVVPGVADVSRPVPSALRNALRRAHRAGTRIASICAGAFVLADAGLLDGRRATTHWLGVAELARRYPAIEVDPDVLYVDEGDVLTSAGAAAGLDLCLHLIRRDYGAAVAADAARLAVMPLERSGGQSQFIVRLPPEPEGASLEPLLRWMEENLDAPLSLRALAARVATSERTFHRRFREQTGTTPLQWIVRARVRRAQHLLETSDHPIDSIAERVGFASASALREHFRRIVTTTPQAYRRSFRASLTGR